MNERYRPPLLVHDNIKVSDRLITFDAGIFTVR